jgi:predicted porin
MAAANAADLSLDSVKDPLPDTLSWSGITLYGTIDVGYGYQSHGAPLGGSFPQGVSYNIYSSKYANKAISGLDPNAIERSAIGLKVEEPIGAGWAAIARLETSFDPLTGELSDGPSSLLRNAGKALAYQSANGDSGRAGQAFNGPLYAGVSNASYGTLTVGRQQSLQLDVSAAYDPQNLAYAFSLLGWSSSLVGSGITEAARWDNSVKYSYEYGPVHAAAEYAQGGDDTGFFGPAYGFNIGGKLAGFSVDAVYQKVNAGVQLSADASTPANIYSAPATYSTSALKAQITDSDSWSVQGKYTFGLGGGFKDGGYKNDFADGAKLTLYAGFEDIRFYNSSAARDLEYVGRTAIGGYLIGTPIGSSYYYSSTRELQVEWGGVKYELPSGWSFTAAYYHLDQNSFTGKVSGPQVGSPNQQPGTNSGSYDDASFVVDYRFTKHFDVYGGINYSTIGGGLASGYLANNNTSFVTGARLKF